MNDATFYGLCLFAGFLLVALAAIADRGRAVPKHEQDRRDRDEPSWVVGGRL